MARILFILLGIFLITVASIADANNDKIVIKMEAVTDSERALVSEIFKRIRRNETISGEFFQTDNFTQKNKGALGFFYFQTPRKLNFTYSPPNKIQIISNGQQIMIKDEKRRSKKYYPAGATPMKFLTEDPVKLAYSDKIQDVYEKGDKIFVRMAQDSVLGKADMTVEFSKISLELLGWTVHEKKNDVHVELYNMEYNKPLDKDLFYVEPHETNERN